MPFNVIPASYLSFLRKQESSHFKSLWIPAFAGMTRFLTFYDSVKVGGGEGEFWNSESGKPNPDKPELTIDY